MSRLKKGFFLLGQWDFTTKTFGSEPAHEIFIFTISVRTDYEWIVNAADKFGTWS